MRIILAAFLLLAAVAGYWQQFESIEQFRALLALKDPIALKDAFVVFIALWFFIEGIVRVGQAAVRKGETRELPTQETKEPPKQSLRELEERLEERTRQVSELRGERDQLATAKKDLEARLTASKKSEHVRPEAVNAELVHLLSIFQEKGRLIDFLMDDIAPYDDAQVGAAARVIHQGCSSVLKRYFEILPVHQGSEGESVTLEDGFNSRQYRLVGKVAGSPPFSGVVLHRGWQTKAVTLPRVAVSDSASQEIIAPTEVELR